MERPEQTINLGTPEVEPSWTSWKTQALEAEPSWTPWQALATPWDILERTLKKTLESPSYRRCQAKPILEGPALKGRALRAHLAGFSGEIEQRAFVLILQHLGKPSENYQKVASGENVKDSH